MKWRKYGLIFSVDGQSPWRRHSALQPTPILLNEGTIRVFVGFRDEKGASRIGFVDLNSRDPTNVVRVSEEPLLDVGAPGMFDEDGVVPCAVIRRNDGLFLYYAGYQLGRNIKFHVFGGLAISKDDGKTFSRYRRVPITDRTDKEPYFRVIHSLLLENGLWKVWYGAGDRFEDFANKQYPSYDIRYSESRDGISIDENFMVAVPTSADEYRVGRPYVIRNGGAYQMFFC